MSNQITTKKEKPDSLLTIAQAHPKLFFGLLTTTLGVSFLSSIKWKNPQPLVVTSGLVAVGALQFWNVFNPKPKPKTKVRERASSVVEGTTNPPRLKRVDSVRVNQFSNTPPVEIDEEGISSHFTSFFFYFFCFRKKVLMCQICVNFRLRFTLLQMNQWILQTTKHWVILSMTLWTLQ